MSANRYCDHYCGHGWCSVGCYDDECSDAAIEYREYLAAARAAAGGPPDKEDDQCPPGLHSMFDPCPGGCLNGDEEDTPGGYTAEVEPGVRCSTPETHNWHCGCRCGQGACQGTHIPNGDGEMVCTPDPVVGLCIRSHECATPGQGPCNGLPRGVVESKSERHVHSGRGCTSIIEKERRGFLATVRGWWRRFGDWLDPHAANDREYAAAFAEWRRRHHRPKLDERGYCTRCD